MQRLTSAIALPLLLLLSPACSQDNFSDGSEICDSCDQASETGRIHGTVSSDTDELLPDDAYLQLYQLVDDGVETNEDVREVIVIADIEIDANGRYTSPANLPATPIYARVWNGVWLGEWISGEWHEWTVSGDTVDRAKLLVFADETTRYDFVVGKQDDGTATIDFR